MMPNKFPLYELEVKKTDEGGILEVDVNKFNNVGSHGKYIATFDTYDEDLYFIENFFNYDNIRVTL